jgi:hypothetical protein
MQKSAFILAGLLSFSNGLFSQIVLERTINWTTPKEITLPYEPNEQPEKKTILHFQNATYGENDKLVPAFFELIRINENYRNFSVKINNEIYTELSAQETSALIDHFIPGNLIIPETQIFYERKIPFINLRLIPIRINPATGKYEKLLRFQIEIVQEPEKTVTSLTLKNSFGTNSFLSSGKWVKIRIETDGIYQLTYSELVSMGFDNPGNIRLFGNGNKMLPLYNNEPRIDDLIEKAVHIEKGADNVFNQGDYILFYAQGVVGWEYNPATEFFEHSKHLFSKYNYYFLTTSPGEQKAVSDLPQPAEAYTHVAETFNDYRFHEEELNNLILSGRQWFGELFDVQTSKAFSFSFPNIVIGTQVKVKSTFAARSPVNSNFNISVNQQTIFSTSIPSVIMTSYISDYADVRSGNGTFNATDGNIDLTVNYSKPSPSSQGWLDYIIVNARRNLIMSGSQMHFRDLLTVGADNITEFRISGAQSGLKVWDVSDPWHVKNITGSIEGNSYRFKHNTDTLVQFIAFTNNNFLKPVIIGNVPNQNLHGLTQTDYIIITHPRFLSHAMQLANYRSTNDGLNVTVVTPEQIYNEFSSGRPDVAALRNFVKMFYERAVSEAEMPKYLLLFGDGSFNNLEESTTNTNLILTYQSENSLRPTQSFVTDDFFGLLDDDEGGHTGMLDIGIGRLPVVTAEQAQNVINKILRYENSENKGDWQNYITFIGDDGDNNIHMQQADFLANFVRDNYSFFNIDKIYLDAYQRVSGSGGQRYPEVNRAIQNRINKGTVLINYTGHGNELRLAHENILDIGDILNLQNRNLLPVFMTATCEFSRFDNPQRTSAGEILLLNPTGGGVALFSTTRLVYATPNFFLNQNFYQYIFSENNGELYRLGDVMRLTKNSSGTGINKLNFTLLGDPAMQLAVPKYEIKITEINGIPVGAIPDTLKAMGRYTIKGEVEVNGTKASYYTGLLYSTVFDKKQQFTTLSNDGNPPFTFEARNNILYRGKSSIAEGKFEFTFYVPKDIQYHIDAGKISTFATGNEGEAKGAFSNFMVGGTSSDIKNDTQGPTIELFMNDRNFVFGGTTNENPVLLAYLSDSTGINTTGSGIGHDITAILNGNLNDPLVLNDFYTSETDDFQKGTIEYPFSQLDEGNHSIKLKAWDVYNNSSEEYLEFVVAKSARLALRNVLNYPNPFTKFTFFHFEHNQPGSQIDIIIQIFTISGRLVKTIETSSFSHGYKPEPIPWDGLDDYGDNIGRGVYLYRVKIRSENGQVAEKYEKLVILK